MLTATEFEQLLSDLKQLSLKEEADSAQAKVIHENLNQIKEVILQPKTPANKTLLLALIEAGQKLVRGSSHD